MIEVKDLVKKYGNHVALDHLNFTIEKGKVYGLLGANGAGKSTTMNIITGYIGATSGTVLVEGKDVLLEPEETKKRIGYLPEIPPLYTEMTVEEYLSFVMKIKRIAKEIQKKHIEELLDRVKLQEVRQRLIRNLSKGYRQRVGLAQALVGWPAIVILDEPTVGLDPQQIIEIRQLIRDLAKEHTVILSSHILAEVQEVCDHILIIQKGKLIASESTTQMMARVASAQTVELIIEGTEAETAAVLATMPAIDGYQLALEEDGFCRVTIESDYTAGFRRALFKVFAQADIAILQMNAVSNSLEDVFLELMNQPQNAAETAQVKEDVQ
ncbi:ABC transporter ATP-binding protein [Enterococcus sp.]|uniref:ABC transporter ATP-binding protein n=1 Tax=Enterococcus sp. TaxID=35783 RepID=UPI00289D72F1|nr:ABC transporter ATP-binding protein [Enterococcus sp.]